ncbi:PTS mannose transporter subunit IID [Hahella sp. CCB-MM4]|uniref:dihydroxyacetone kinase phosphoryl donor subunit DhaM n=1 Tax=Hahella sp. (strain CCB-MM4) TaxID=1926491 RepID=UPI000B9AD046|nr:dihydroxyacetone kinase phosphoryl donor subunit DhaM [Hahella sp. CCB-MM4]OZG75448.1 PTS mannose transporter subunit IID [Hahella sp. CCB-MM4]
MNNIGIVIVSHSALVAEGTAIMAFQIAGDSVPIAWCGGNIEGGLGSNADEIFNAINRAWSDKGVAIFVDLGSTEMNSQIAIDNLEQDKQKKVLIMNAPLVEGVIVASAKASGGESLKALKKAVEELTHSG